MDFNFAGVYSTYSNAELLKILAHPEHYQQEAIDAAMTVLSTRTITDADKEEAGYPVSLPGDTMPQTDETPETGIFDEAPAAPTAQFRSMRLIIVLLVGLQYITNLYYVIHGMYLLFTVGFWPGAILGVLQYALLCAFVGYTIYLLFHLKRLGWIFTGILSLIAIVHYMVRLFHALSDDYSHLSFMYLLLAAMNVIVGYLLGKPEVYGYYLDQASAVKYRRWGVIGAIVYFALRYFLEFMFQSGVMI